MASNTILERLPNANPLEVFLAGFAAVMVLLVVAIIRRIYFHPVSDIPGPFVAKFSSIWQLWVVITGQAGPATVALHKKYGWLSPLSDGATYSHLIGKFVRIGCNEVSVCDPESSLTVLRRNLDKV